MASKQQLSIEQKQTLRLLPIQKQMGELLEMNPHEIEERVSQEIDDNPALEYAVDSDEQDLNSTTEDGGAFNENERSISDYGGNDDDETPYYMRRARNSSVDDDYYEAPMAAEQSLSEFLLNQLREREELSPAQEMIAEYIIGALDDAGYLERTTAAIADDVTFKEGIEVETPEVEEMLATIQELDPAGIGARDVRECLMLQLEREKATDINRLAYDIVNRDFVNLSTRRFDRLLSRYNIDRETLDRVLAKIKSLNAKPASAFAGGSSENQRLQISPDFHVEVNREDKSLTLTLLNRVPELQISESFSLENERLAADGAKSLPRAKRDEAAFIRSKYNSAADFIKVLKMRQDTLFRTMRAIVEKQRDYFLTGDAAAIHPLRLQDIADVIEMDVSVVSRATSNKYVDSIWGIKPLKFFFNERLTTASGVDVSSREVMETIRHIVDDEDKAKPLSDDRILDALHERGYNIKRRTVAKYREQLGIPASTARRRTNSSSN